MKSTIVLHVSECGGNFFFFLFGFGFLGKSLLSVRNVDDEFQIYHHKKVVVSSFADKDPRRRLHPFTDDDLRTNSKLIKCWTEDEGACYATKSSGRLKPPLRFMYCLKKEEEGRSMFDVNERSELKTSAIAHRYFRLRITWTSPLLFPSTFLPFVVSKPQKPIVFIISISSGDLPSKSASETWTLSVILDFDDDGNGERERCLLSRSNDRDLLRDLNVNNWNELEEKLDCWIQTGRWIAKKMSNVSSKNQWWMLIHYTLNEWLRVGLTLSVIHSPRFSSRAAGSTQISVPTRRAFSSFATFRS